ncbi:MAG: zinc-dependent metalloprotease family protein [Planctomycetota bacterium]
MLTTLSILALAAVPQQEVAPVGSLQQLAVPTAPGAGPVLIDLTLDGRPAQLQLERHSLRAGDFKVYAQAPNGDLIQLPAPTPTTWRGSVGGFRDADVTASITDEGLTAIVVDRVGEQSWQIQPAEGMPQGTYSIAQPDELIVPPGVCGVGGGPSTAPPTQSAPARGTGLQLCEIAFDCDFEFFQDNGSSVAGSVNDVERVMNRVDDIYVRDVDVKFLITTIIVRTNSADPYSGNDAGNLLDQFRIHWASTKSFIRRDLAHLMTGRSINGGTIGVAYLAQVCSTGLGYGLSERFTTNLNARTGLTAHEIGHNFSANHCDGSGNCRIMCSGLGGCNNDVTQFGSTANGIRNYAIGRPCLLDLASPLALPVEEPVDSATIDTSRWISNQGVVASTAASNEPTGQRSFQFAAANNQEGGDDFLISNFVLLDGLSDVDVTLFTQARGVNNGNSLQIDYRNNLGDWVGLATVISSGVTDNSFTPRQFALPADAFHDEFQLRISAAVDGSSENWYVDDIQITDNFCGTIAQYCFAGVNSTGNFGQLSTFGSTVISNNDLTFFATAVPANQFGLLVYGEDQTVSPLANGFLCVGGAQIFRYDIVQIDAFGTAGIFLDQNALPFGSVINPGDVLNFQFWHRDIGGAGANLTLPLSVEFCP